MKYCPLIRIILSWRRFPKCSFRRKWACHITFYLQIHGNFGEINVRQRQRQRFNMNVTINKFYRIKVSLKLNFQMLSNFGWPPLTTPYLRFQPIPTQIYRTNTMKIRFDVTIFVQINCCEHLTWRYLETWDVVNRQNSWKNYKLHPLPRAKTKASNLNWRQFQKRMPSYMMYILCYHFKGKVWSSPTDSTFFLRFLFRFPPRHCAATSLCQAFHFGSMLPRWKQWNLIFIVNWIVCTAQ